ncbi:MAG: isoprenylcysteine carboxylmethyltransferase family protein [Steroidobacteraceae bacterium]
MDGDPREHRCSHRGGQNGSAGPIGLARTRVRARRDRGVRHPSYTGALLAFVGYGICLGNWISLAVVTVPIAWAFMRRIEVEELALNGALGERYVAYARRTKRLVPWVY